MNASERAAPNRIVVARHAEGLTGRQIDCLVWTEQGKSARDIGQILGISRKTVEEHIAKACATLGVRTRVQAVVAARAAGLFD